MQLSPRRHPWQRGGHVQFYDHVPMTYSRRVMLWLARDAQFVSGHFHWGSYEAMQPRTDDCLITFLRDPVERLRSSFRFARSLGYSVPPLPSLDLSRTTLRDFLACEDPGWRMHVDNTAVRLLAGRFGYESYSEAQWQTLTEKALDHLGRFALVGIAESLDDHCDDLISLFEVPSRLEISRENVTPSGARDSAAENENLDSDEVQQLLRQFTRFDRVLYEWVTERFGAEPRSY